MGGDGIILLVEDNPADAELVLLSLEFDRFRDAVTAIGRYWVEVNEVVPIRAFIPEAG